MIMAAHEDRDKTRKEEEGQSVICKIGHDLISIREYFILFHTGIILQKGLKGFKGLFY